MATHNDLGRRGESIAKTHLESLGYEIIDENWTHGKLEVDLIAYKKSTIIFIEVKAPHRYRFWPARRFCG